MTLFLIARLFKVLGITMLTVQGVPTTEDTLFVECREGSDHTLRGPIITSPSGYRAYVTVAAQMRRLGHYSEPVCANTSSLFVASPGATGFSMVFRIDPTTEELGNGLKVVDWGPDGRTLAAHSFVWQRNSHDGGRGILIYRAEKNQVLQPDIHELFSRVFGKECIVRLDDVLGFTKSGELVVKVGNYFDPYAYPEPIWDKPCLSNEGQLWALNVRANKARRLPNGYLPRHYRKKQG